ncbi:sulfatase-like hydrolase/transferase [Nocardioides sp. TF02-7]|uniref:sulfatase-like hydrolase/transferase n=1 Tax=Nocardioides sp. TF02-7 TaxID=2917724 RepID=UPI001F05ECC1|nr:sulfatase-like hydrolase/transferase [Nocardioides sp. TF02-7]UMG94956.1 sulfatase-like hydrolase/transferase [Nocardioides sp. TF02-7]
MLTGQYGHNSGVQTNRGRWGGYQSLRQPDNTIATWLQDAGYLTSHHGKYLNLYQLEASPTERGWTVWDTQVRGTYTYDKRAIFVDGDTYRNRYISGIIAARSNRAITRFAKADQPFFTVVNHVAPHNAAEAEDGDAWGLPVAQRKYRRHYARLRPTSAHKPSYLEKDVSDLPSDLRRHSTTHRRMTQFARARARALRSADDAVASTIRRLKRLGELDNTYVVFASDNGFLLGEHRLRGKDLPFDEALEIPLVVRGPGVARGARVHEPVTLVDLTATFLDWAGGVEPGRTLDGLSLRRLTRGSRDTLPIQIGDTVADATPGWRYWGVTTRRYLYAVHAGRPSTGVLFDRLRDPHALVNRLYDPAYTHIRAELERRSSQLIRCNGQKSCNQAFGPLAGPKPWAGGRPAEPRPAVPPPGMQPSGDHY